MTNGTGVPASLRGGARKENSGTDEGEGASRVPYLKK